MAQKNKQFEIRFLQEREIISIENQIVTLKRKPFQIQVEFHNHTRVYLNARIDSEYFNLSHTEIPSFVKEFGYCTLADPSHNREKTIFVNTVNSYGFHELSIKPTLQHAGFDEIHISEKRKIGTRTINSLYADQKIEIAQYDYDLFLTFVSVRMKDGKKTANQRNQYQIVWETKASKPIEPSTFEAK